MFIFAVQKKTHYCIVKTVTVNLVEKINTIGMTKGGNHDNLTAALVEMETYSK